MKIGKTIGQMGKRLISGATHISAKYGGKISKIVSKAPSVGRKYSIRFPRRAPRPRIAPRRPIARPRVAPRRPTIAPRPRVRSRPRTIPRTRIPKRNVPHRNIPNRGIPHRTTAPKRTTEAPKVKTETQTPKTSITETPKKSWKDKVMDTLNWAGAIGNALWLGWMVSDILGGGNEAYAEDYPYDYGDYGYGDYGYSDYGYGGGYGDYGYGGYGDYGYGDYGGYLDSGYGIDSYPYEDDGGLSDIGFGEGDTTGEETADNLEDYYPIDENGDGEPEYYYNPDTGEILTPEEYEGLSGGNGVLDNIDKHVESLANNLGVPKELIYAGGVLAVAGGLYYLAKKKKKKKA
jgi:hypothetical protein